MNKADRPGRTNSSRRLGRKALAWCLPICALATGLAFTVPGTAATAAVTGPASRSAYTTFPGRLYSVAAISENDAWAAGLGSSGSLIVHWNGKGWTRVPSPNVPGSTGSFLNAVTAISAGNAWAVGNATVGGRSQSLTMHWNGQQWTLVPGNTPGGDASLLGVTSSWTNNIWAVGITNPTQCSNGGPKCQTLVEHWNGVRWKVIPSPNPPSAYLNLVWGISAVSRTDIWAVGTTDYGSTLIVHWNGTSWS
jgi:hypothetical protein